MLTVGVLFIALAVCVTLGTTILNNIQDVTRWIDRTVGVADYFIRATMPDMATGIAADIPKEVGDELRKIDGIATIGMVRRVRTRVNDLGAVLTVRDFSPSDPLPLDLKVGEENDVRRRLEQGEVVLGAMLAQRAHLSVGDDVTLDTLNGPKPFCIAGIANEYTVGGLTVFMERGVAERLLGVEGVDAYVIKTKPGRFETVGNTLQNLCQEDGLILQSAASLRSLVDTMMAGIVGCLWGLLALAVIVAAFGIVNTLTMNVLEQTRELAILRVVAMTRRQIRRTILCQAAILAMIGLLPGAAIGAFLAWLMHVGTVRQFGHGAAYSGHPGFVIGLWAMAYAIVVIAALLPAERAARLELLTALHYE
jgi:putative ABC transport system permease protein